MTGGLIFLTFSLVMLAIAICIYQDIRVFRSVISSSRNRNFAETTPAKQLVPRLDQIVGSGKHLFVTSAEATYPESEPGGNMWIEALDRWSKDGLKITYLIVGPGDEGRCTAVATLAQKHRDTFEILRFDRSSADGPAVDTAELLHVTHPTYLRGIDGDVEALWLERYHSPETGMAMDVSYVGPAKIVESDLIGIYVPKVESVLASSRKLTSDELAQICSSRLAAA